MEEEALRALGGVELDLPIREPMRGTAATQQVIILDTNVVSELMKPAPADKVIRSVASQTATSLYTTSITYAESCTASFCCPQASARKTVEQAAETMFDEDFAGRILPFGSDGASFYAEVATERQRRGRPISQLDAQIATIATATGAGLAPPHIGLRSLRHRCRRPIVLDPAWHVAVEMVARDGIEENSQLTDTAVKS